jgi:peptidoglycan hydrolase-like protein with peptidoglycan-binding domain
MTTESKASETPDPVPSERSEPAAGKGAPRRRRRGVRAGVTAGVAVVVVGAGVTYALIQHDSSEASASSGYSNGSPTSLVPITKGKLSSRIPVSGTLGYEGSYKILNAASGKFTKLPSVGQVIKKGQVIYRVDGKPVFFLKGSTPVYRDLKRGLRGSDVRALNRALVEMGYADKDTLDPDSNYYGWATEDAVEEWQEDLDLDETGVVASDFIVFLPLDELRVTSVAAGPGAPAGTSAEVFQASSTTRQVSVELDASSQSEVEKGDQVSITLPTLKTTPGVVTSVGSVATKSSDGTLTVDVLIRPQDKKATGTLDKAPVQVSIVTDSEASVLSVPVNALLALANGEYAVEVVGDDGVHTLVPIQLGIFDSEAGQVAVTGTGLAAGQKVVVPAS